MKIDRLIGIIVTLQQRRKVTAPYLAEKFEVSVRTIFRDVEDICKAGIPLVTTPGVDGGIAIMEGFQLNNNVFTREELQALFAGLQSVESVLGKKSTSLLTEKLGAFSADTGYMMIDLSSFYQGSLSEKIKLIKQAIEEHRLVKFSYYYEKGHDVKLVEPYKIVYHWTAWYLFGYCPARNDFRLYKLHRLWDLILCEEEFMIREVTEHDLSFGQNITDDKQVEILYDSSVKWRLIEEYGPQCFQEQEDGKLYTNWGFSTYEKAVTWVLSFGSLAEVIGPPEFKEMYLSEVRKMQSKYKT